MLSEVTMMKFRILIDNKLCKGCVLCVHACLHSVFSVSQNLSKRGQNVIEVEKEENCEGCRACTDICPDAAIQIGMEKSTAPLQPTTSNGQRTTDN